MIAFIVGFILGSLCGVTLMCLLAINRGKNYDME